MKLKIFMVYANDLLKSSLQDDFYDCPIYDKL